jgi:NAD(P)-dependent dehydrogenase (short-subunit alcohol dehydrogenase family)
MPSSSQATTGRLLEGRLAWITGASRGLGRSLALAFAAAGAELALTARSAEPLEELCEKVRADGGSARALPGSITDPAFAAAAAATLEAEHGRLDVLVNNAGISPYFKRAEHLTTDEVRDVIETNLLGTFDCCRAAADLLAAAPEASVVNVSSIHGSRAYPRLLAYAASKGGVEMLTRSLAVEWAPRGIRVNSLAPGYIETEMTAGLRENPKLSAEILAQVPLGRFARPEEIAAGALFLAGPGSSYMTGSTLFLDGGWSAR